jgi:hypothetical protein
MKIPFFCSPAEPCPAFPRRRAMYRPIIPIHMYSPDLKYRIQHYALLDTGADYNLFHADFLNVLNGDYLEEGKREDVFGIEGNGVATYFHDVVIEIGSWRYKTPTGFTNSGMVTAPEMSGILGEVGFFNHFKVTFDYEKRQIDIKPTAQFIPYK